MKNGLQVALAIGAGYLLGRRRKMRLAAMLGIAAMTGQLGGGGLTGQLARRGAAMLGPTDLLGKVAPELGEITDMIRGEVLDAAKTAAMAAVSSQIYSLSDSLRDRADALQHPADVAQEAAGGVREAAGGVREAAGGVREAAGGVREAAGGVHAAGGVVRGGIRGVTRQAARGDEEEEGGGLAVDEPLAAGTVDEPLAAEAEPAASGSALRQAPAARYEPGADEGQRPVHPQGRPARPARVPAPIRRTRT
jgi:hypothetical protein